MARPLLGLLAATAMLTGCDPGYQGAASRVENTFDVFTGLTEEVDVQIHEDLGMASVVGAWTIEGDDKIADPINVSRIECDREGQYCTDNRAWITTGDITPTLMSAVDVYRLKEWSADHITAELADGCRTIELDIAPNAVTTLTKSAVTCTAGESSPVAKPRLGRLISGHQLDEERKAAK